MSIVNCKGVWVVTDLNGMTVAKIVQRNKLCRWIETTNVGGRV